MKHTGKGAVRKWEYHESVNDTASFDMVYGLCMFSFSLSLSEISVLKICKCLLKLWNLMKDYKEITKRFVESQWETFLISSMRDSQNFDEGLMISGDFFTVSMVSSRGVLQKWGP